MPLMKFKPGDWTPYVNVPEVEDGVLVLTTLVPGPSGTYVRGVGQTIMPEYSVGEVLQWAVLAETVTPPVTLNIGVQDGRGDENRLSIREQLIFEGPLSWQTSEPVVVDNFKPYVYLWIPEVNKQLLVHQIALGDPTSINELMQRVPTVLEDWLPMAPAKGPPLPRFLGILWPWLKG